MKSTGDLWMPKRVRRKRGIKEQVKKQPPQRKKERSEPIA
jgi:hypothetical protein